MISVNVKFIGNEVKSIIVNGHANYDDYGKDIVCAGVSAVVTGGINALSDYINDITLVNNKNELGVIVNKSNEVIQIILKTILIQLETIEESYKENIKINK